MKFLNLQVEDVTLGRYYRSGHVSAGGVEQGVNASVLGYYVVAVLLYCLLVHYVGFHKLGLAAVFHDVVGDFLADVFLSSEDYHLCAVLGEVFCYCAAEHSGTAGDYNYVILDIK